MSKSIAVHLADARAALTAAIAQADKNGQTFNFSYPALKLEANYTPKLKELTKAEALDLLKSGKLLSVADRNRVVKALEDPAPVEEDSSWDSSWNSSSC